MKHFFLILTLSLGCNTSSIQDGDITASECKGSSLGKDLDTGYEPETSLTSEVSGSDIIVHLIDVNANCCPDPGADISIDGNSITIDFYDLVDSGNGCLCMCWTDFDITIENPGAGSWLIEVNHNDSFFGSTEIEL